jgi:hypothetical protein
MRRFMSTCLVAAGLIVGTLSLSGCIIAPPRGGYHHGYWESGHYGSRGGWVPGHWR